MRNRHSLLWQTVLVLAVVAGLLVLPPLHGWSQTTVPQEGLRSNTPQVHALVNARIVQAAGRVIEKGTIILRDGVIEAVGTNIALPADARIWDYQGLTVYPGLIETYSQAGLPQPAKGENRSSGSTDAKEKRGIAHWNPQVHPQDNAAAFYQPEKKELEKLRALGFTAALVAPDKGIFRGSSALVSLGDGTPNDNLLREQVAQQVAFERSRNRTLYPNSLMGAIALIRQTLLDAQWYRQAHQAYRLKPGGQTAPEENEALAALAGVVQGRQPVMMVVDDELAFLRAVKIAREFGLQLWVRGSGHEYRQLDLIKAARVPVILPVNFPPDPAVETPEEALGVSLFELRHWDAAPENPKRLYEAGVPFTLTSAGLKKATDFHARVRQAIERGLPQDAALAALTTTPARLLGMARQLGSIEAGKLGHLTVTDGALFAEKTKIRDVWIGGKRYEVTPKPLADPRGKWQLTLNPPGASPVTATLELQGEVERLRGRIVQDDSKTRLQRAILDRKRLVLLFSGDSLGYAGVIRLSGVVEKERLRGQGELPDGQSFTWTATLLESTAVDTATAAVAVAAEPALPAIYPPGAFGRPGLPEQPKHILVRGATIWTSGPQGKLENADMLVTEGKIVRIGPNLKPPPGAMVIEAKGKQVTPGLIDTHSHTAGTGGINESTQAVTAEVRIGDVLQSYDMALYRELAGGLTMANVLHGSANPIGGQNAVIKLRWGAPPEALKFDGARPGIKFALGENVKQSNWGDRFTTRYPQTRMGVEQIIRDRFKAALDYEKAWQEYNARKNKKGVIPPRRDLELEALLEVIRHKRLVHSHSYRQDEILALIRIADDFGFTVGSFEHVLEGYKVADAIARHGAGASTFSDWWAYKFEVYDAIPYNGALMHDAGVVVTYNSDSSELARRLNTEAAKAVKYGGVSEEEALKFVTLNAARLLKIDRRVGSLEPGKDADFVIWSGHPLSTYTICEQTWIDGRRYFDREEDLKMREQVAQERARLIQKLLKLKKKEEKEEDKPTATEE